MNRYAIIMAGGTGERFWPVSRLSTPKHLAKIFSDRTILEETVERLSKFVDRDKIIIITNKFQVEAINAIEALKNIKVYAEPMGRDTTAAIALSAKLVKAECSDATIAVFPCDQIIKDVDAFAKCVNSAYELAESGDKLITISIKPTFPSVNYGYINIEGEEAEQSGSSYYKVARFVEKPNLEKASEYLAEGGYFWNAGIFVWSLNSIEKALKAHATDIYEALENTDDIDSVYPTLRKISIDFSVMEKADNIYTVKGEFDWDDIGAWSAIARFKEADSKGNVIDAKAVSLEANDNILVDKTGRFTALFGVDNLVVVHTKDATMICAKDKLDELKKLLGEIPEEYKK